MFYNYLQTKQMCEDSTREIVVMSYVNFIMSVTMLLVMIFIRGILQDGEVNKRCQYVVEKMFKIRKDKFKDHQGIVKELDLVEEDDKITHEVSLDDQDLGTKENVMD